MREITAPPRSELSATLAAAATNAALLRQALDVVTRAGSERYVSGTPVSPGGTVGRHVRHVLEFYEGLFHGLPSGRVDYARRVRDAAVETDPARAASRIEAALDGLARLAGEPPELPLDVRCEEGDPWCGSTLMRELQALTSHTVHHFALVAAILRALGFEPPSDFGVASSTLLHWERTGR